MDDVTITQVRVTKKAAIISGVIVLIALLFRRPTVAMGLIFGTLVGILNFRLMAIALIRAVTLPANKAKLYAGSRYIIRYAIMGVVLYSAARRGELGFFLATAGGLLTIKLAVLWEGLLGK